MIICSECSSSNREGELFCIECGNPLIGSPSISTRRLDSARIRGAGQSSPTKPFRKVHRFGKGVSVVMHLGQVSKPLVVAEKPEIMIGRRDEESGNFPDIDLTPYGALDEGVSRIHARLQQSEDALTIIDLSSVNGTYLNGERLIPNQPRILHDGDEIRFGKLITRVYFRASGS